METIINILEEEAIGNMTQKGSYNKLGPVTKYPEKLNYNFSYTYSDTHPHRAIKIHNWYYSYDSNGNVIERSTTQPSSYEGDDTAQLNGEIEEKENTDYANEAYARQRTGEEETDGYTYSWNEENRLTEATVNANTTYFLYNANGERTVKKGEYSETIYADKMYQLTTSVNPMLTTKHIFVGTTRIVSKLSHQDLGFIDNEYAKNNTFYIHQDHLGSSNIISDRDGNEYEHLLFCPYGETWAEEGEEQVLGKITYKFTSKELDEETNLYYFGARYLDPVTSRWMSCDPAFREYLPSPRGNNSNLPGLGGVFNPINLNVYCYAGNNPIKYVDPDGEKQNIAQKVFSAVLKFAVSKSAKIKNFVQKHASVSVTRNVYEGKEIIKNGTTDTYYKDNLSVKVGPIELNNLQVQSTVDYPGTPADWALANESNHDAKIGASGATKPFIDDTLQITGPYFLHEAYPRENDKPYSQGCPVTKTDAKNKEVMNIIRDKLKFKNNETIKFKFTKPNTGKAKKNIDK